MPATLTIRAQPLPYIESLQSREPASIDLLVIHCTELPELADARDYAERIVHPSGTGNSGHYYLDRDGSGCRYVPIERVAHHVRGHNAHTIGIELVNRGRYPDWYDTRRQSMHENYPTAQIDALLALIAQLRGQLSGLRRIAGHEDLDTEQVPASNDAALTVRRKLDPGPRFPWSRIVPACGLERWTPPL